MFLFPCSCYCLIDNKVIIDILSLLVLLFLKKISSFFFCCSVAHLCLTFCSLMDCSTPGFPSLSRRVCSNSCLLSWWCHPTVSSCVVPFSSCLQSFPASGSFPVSHFFTSGGQSIGASASASVLLMNIQGWSPLGLTGLISLLSKGVSRVLSSTTV